MFGLGGMVWYFVREGSEKLFVELWEGVFGLYIDGSRGDYL